LCADLHLADHVRFVGYQRGEALLRHVASFDIGVTPDPSNLYNDYCSFLKTMEYMAMGKPVVCFDLPENRKSAGDAALYARPNNVEELALQIARLMDDAALRKQLGAIGRGRAATVLSWEHQERELLNAYESMLMKPLTRIEPMHVPAGSTQISESIIRPRVESAQLEAAASAASRN
jgi:glycosyltransferase involved in cell wall biosynthesis